MYLADVPAEARSQLERQAAGDWSEFLAARSAELAPGGRLLIQGIGTITDDDGTERVSASRLLGAMWAVARGARRRRVAGRETCSTAMSSRSTAGAPRRRRLRSARTVRCATSSSRSSSMWWRLPTPTGRSSSDRATVPRTRRPTPSSCGHSRSPPCVITCSHPARARRCRSPVGRVLPALPGADRRRPRGGTLRGLDPARGLRANLSLEPGSAAPSGSPLARFHRRRRHVVPPLPGLWGAVLPVAWAAILSAYMLAGHFGTAATA